MTRRAKCRTGHHIDRPVRGSGDVVCEKCGDRFPCSHTCGHVDCRSVKGEALPEFVGPEAREACLGELEAMYAGATEEHKP